MIPENVHLNIGSLLFEDLDQIDLTGPFEVVSRLPNATHRIYAKTMDPVHQPLIEDSRFSLTRSAFTHGCLAAA
jgi:hypothetical protein